MDLALNNQQRLICHKTNQTKPIVCKMGAGDQVTTALWCFVSRIFFKTACSILEYILSIFFFFVHLVRIHVVHLYSNIYTATAWKKPRFVFSGRSDFNRNENQSIAVQAFNRCLLTYVIFLILFLMLRAL